MHINFEQDCLLLHLNSLKCCLAVTRFHSSMYVAFVRYRRNVNLLIPIVKYLLVIYLISWRVWRNFTVSFSFCFIGGCMVNSVVNSKVSFGVIGVIWLLCNTPHCIVMAYVICCMLDRYQLLMYTAWWAIHFHLKWTQQWSAQRLEILPLPDTC